MKRYIFLSVTAFCMFSLFGINASAQKKNKSYLDYIERFHSIAQRQQSMYKVPSSITLAQGLLESGAGSSSLAVKSHNHFGIKCHNFPGECVSLLPGDKNQIYRKYKKDEDSYEDHSKFLVQNSRYNVLFTYHITDYKAWAKGLQHQGYATDKAYANKLIQLIELYELYRYDTDKKVKAKEEVKPKETKPQEVKPPKTKEKKPDTSAPKRQPRLMDDLLYVKANENDSFEQIAKDMGFKVSDLLKFNEVPKGFPLGKGDIVYLEKKRKKAGKSHFAHTVKIGESMHGISQQYGIRVKSLYKLNKKDGEYVPTEGDVLRVR